VAPDSCAITTRERLAGPRPGVVLQTAQALNEQTVNRLEEKLVAKFSGRENWQRPLVLEQGLTASPWTLTPAEMEGGTFTITNLGGIGGTGFSPIVNYSIWFRSASLFDDFEKRMTLRRHSALVCPGMEIRLAQPVLKRQQRIKLEMSNVRLQEIAGSSAR